MPATTSDHDAIRRDLTFHAERLGIGTSSELEVLIERLTRRSPPDRAEAWRSRALTRAERLARAHQALAVLDERLARFGADLPDTQASRRLLGALEQGSDEALAGSGISVEYAWVDDILRAAIGGDPHVRFETFGPYVDGHVDPIVRLGPLDEARLPADERVGLQLMSMFADLTAGFANVTLASLIDDRVEEPALQDQVSLLFLLAVAHLLEEYGVIADAEVDLGHRVVLTLETDMEHDLAELIRLLDESDDGTIVVAGNGDVTYLPTAGAIERLALHSRNRNRELARRGIALVRDGVATCHALDAASHLHPASGVELSVVVLDMRFAAEQDRVYALLRGAGLVRQRNSHPIFFDSDLLDPVSVLYGVAGLLRRHAGSIAEELERYDDWSDQDPVEYVERNYGRTILPEDERLIGYVIERLDASGIEPDSLSAVADVGAGPNLYPAMLLAPYLAPSGVIDLIEPSDRCRGCVRSTLGHRDHRIWAKFGDLMEELSDRSYRDALERVFDRCQSIAGSIHALPTARYQVVLSFFSTESITSSRAEFRTAVENLVGAVKPGGILIGAHMLHSEGWYAGEDTRFPAVPLHPLDVQEAYRDADCEFDLSVVEHPPPGGAVVRAGYEGMAVVVARPRPQRTGRFLISPDRPAPSPFAGRLLAGHDGPLPLPPPGAPAPVSA